MSEQLELPLPEGEDNIIYFESTTITADSLLAANLGYYTDVFIIGLTEDGLCYRASNGDGPFWAYALEKARNYIMNSMDN